MSGFLLPGERAAINRHHAGLARIAYRAAVRAHHLDPAKRPSAEVVAAVEALALLIGELPWLP